MVIQRIQTLFLLLIIPVNAGFVMTPMFSHAMLDPQGWLSNGLIAGLLFSVLLSVYTVMQFRNRHNQVKWVKRAMLFQVISIGMVVGVFFTVGRLGSHLMGEALSIGLLVLGLLLQYLALCFIHKDIEKVASIDRIR